MNPPSAPSQSRCCANDKCQFWMQVPPKIIPNMFELFSEQIEFCRLGSTNPTSWKLLRLKKWEHPSRGQLILLSLSEKIDRQICQKLKSKSLPSCLHYLWIKGFLIRTPLSRQIRFTSRGTTFASRSLSYCWLSFPLALEICWVSSSMLTFSIFSSFENCQIYVSTIHFSPSCSTTVVVSLVSACNRSNDSSSTSHFRCRKINLVSELCQAHRKTLRIKASVRTAAKLGQTVLQVGQTSSPRSEIVFATWEMCQGWQTGQLAKKTAQQGYWKEQSMWKCLTCKLKDIQLVCCMSF